MIVDFYQFNFFITILPFYHFTVLAIVFDNVEKSDICEHSLLSYIFRAFFLLDVIRTRCIITHVWEILLEFFYSILMPWVRGKKI